MPQCQIPQWLQIAQGLLTPLIAIVTAYIAWQQWNATKLKMRIERYERRLRVYQATHRFILEVVTTTKPEITQMFGFYSETAEADFIFPPQVRKYLDEVFSHANQLNLANTLYRPLGDSPPEGYDHAEVCQSQIFHKAWFNDQAPLAKEVFKPFLDLSW